MHVEGDDEVAALTLFLIYGHSLTTEAQLALGLGACVDLHAQLLAREGGDSGFATEHCCGERYGEVGVEVVTLALEGWVGSDAEGDVEVATLTTLWGFTSMTA